MSRPSTSPGPDHPPPGATQKSNTNSANLADLLRIVLGVERRGVDVATPSFAPWVIPGSGSAWPPRADARGGLWLIDTRDRPGLGELLSGEAGRRYDVALILSGSGPPGSPLRRLLRRVRRRAPRRAGAARVAAALASELTANHRRLGFEDGSEVPMEFDLTADDSTGAAFLLTRDTPFTGPAWSLVGERLHSPRVDVISFQLRARGAAVVIVEAGGPRFVIRMVPDGPLQPVVLKNHSALTQLRRDLGSHVELLRLMPEPVFADRIDSIAVLGETCLGGRLAWRQARGPLGTRIRLNALRYLDALKTATIRPLDGAVALAGLLRDDEQRVDTARFANDRVRDSIRRELRDAAAVLASNELEAYMSHGDFGYGNILVDPGSGDLEGVIDWDTTRRLDLPGIDRVNLEIQIRRTVARESFPQAVKSVWHRQLAGDALEGSGGAARVRALFGLAVCRYVTRAMSYPDLYRMTESDYERTLVWLRQVPGHGRV